MNELFMPPPAGSVLRPPTPTRSRTRELLLIARRRSRIYVFWRGAIRLTIVRLRVGFCPFFCSWSDKWLDICCENPTRILACLLLCCELEEGVTLSWAWARCFRFYQGTLPAFRSASAMLFVFCFLYSFPRVVVALTSCEFKSEKKEEEILHEIKRKGKQKNQKKLENTRN